MCVCLVSQSEREVAKSRSAPIALDDLRADKNKSKAIRHLVKLDVDDSLYAGMLAVRSSTLLATMSC